MSYLYSELVEARGIIDPIKVAVASCPVGQVKLILLSPDNARLFTRTGYLRDVKSPAGPFLQVGLKKIPAREQNAFTDEGWDIWIES